MPSILRSPLSTRALYSLATILCCIYITSNEKLVRVVATSWAFESGSAKFEFRLHLSYLLSIRLLLLSFLIKK